jgi:L-asparaginase/Glu-tRNA(Gln) amidotransferase subunit D
MLRETSMSLGAGSLPSVVELLAMGGTISATLQGSDGYSARLGADALLPARFALPDITVRATEFTCEQSFSVRFETTRRLITHLTQCLADSRVRGVAITHGTAVMQVVFYRTATGRTTLPFPPLPLPRVEVIKAVMDMDDLLLQAAIGAGARGLVIEGFPGEGSANGRDTL